MRRLLVSVAFLAFAAAPAMAAPTAESKACSDQATAKGLHGADREKFRADCLKTAAPAGKPAAAAKPAVAPMPAPAPMAAAAPMAAPAPKAATAPMAAAPAKPAAAPAAAKIGVPKSDESKACSDKATAKGLHGAERETFRAACLKGAPPSLAKPMVSSQPTPAPAAAMAKPAAPMAAAKPAPAAMATPPEPTAASMKAAAPTSGKPRTANQLASDARIKKCGAMWQTDKAAGKTAGLTWPKYWSACSARLKASGQ